MTMNHCYTFRSNDLKKLSKQIRKLMVRKGYDTFLICSYSRRRGYYVAIECWNVVQCQYDDLKLDVNLQEIEERLEKIFKS